MLAVNRTGEFRAGGTDIGERRRHHISTGPVIDIPYLPKLAAIEWENGAARIGAQVTIKNVATDSALQASYPGLCQAAGGLATPQIRAMAQMGGSLLQRTRCWYFRHPHETCFKKGGASCPARDGHNPRGVVFDKGACVYPHPSTLGMALLAYEAQIVVQDKGERSVEQLYGDGSDPTRDHLLEPDELLTHILLPAPLPGEQAAYLRAISRFEAEWPLVEVIVRLQVQQGKITFARVAVGGVANIPLRLLQVEAALVGQAAQPKTLEQAARHASAGTTPLRETGYKVALIERTALEGLEQALKLGQR